MKIQTFSVVIGTSACNANCQFCVSHTTGFDSLPKTQSINYANLDKAIQLARIGGCTTLLFTGKGEPTLYPGEITQYMYHLDSFAHRHHFFFPFVELQTNALDMGDIAKALPDTILQKEYTSWSEFCDYVLEFSVKDKKLPVRLRSLIAEMREWKKTGMSTIAISTVGIKKEDNKKTYLHHRDAEYPDLERTVKFLHQFGFSIRLCVMMQKGMVDNMPKLRSVAEWCKKNHVAQLTARSIRKPILPVLNATEYADYIQAHGLDEQEINKIKHRLDTEEKHIMTLMHGKHQAKVYDLDGQNLCMSDCLTVEPDDDSVRTLIYWADGKISHDWQFPGARLL